MQFCAYMYYLTSKSEMKSTGFEIQFKNVYIRLHMPSYSYNRHRSQEDNIGH